MNKLCLDLIVICEVVLWISTRQEELLWSGNLDKIVFDVRFISIFFVS
jgi:hypothetical protein